MKVTLAPNSESKLGFEPVAISLHPVTTDGGTYDGTFISALRAARQATQNTLLNTLATEFKLTTQSRTPTMFEVLDAIEDAPIRASRKADLERRADAYNRVPQDEAFATNGHLVTIEGPDAKLVYEGIMYGIGILVAAGSIDATERLKLMQQVEYEHLPAVAPLQ